MKTNEKSKWFYSEFKQDTVAVILLIHGLNLRPSKMDSLAQFFAAKKCDVYRLALPENPKNWIEKFDDGYHAALEQAEILERPLFLIGYSLGALLTLRYLVTHNYHKINKVIFIAIPLEMKWLSRLPAKFSWIMPRAWLPSLALEDYRIRGKTSLIEYRIMESIRSEILAVLKKLKKADAHISSPVLIISDPKDELLDIEKIKNHYALFSSLQCHEVTNKVTQHPKKYHHLMIDEASIGHIEWQKMLNKMTSHLSL